MSLTQEIVIAYAKAEWDAGNDQAVTDVLNAKTINNVQLSSVSMKSMLDNTDRALTAKFVRTVDEAITTLRSGTDTERELAALLYVEMRRFADDQTGIDLRASWLRTDLTTVLTAAGWAQADIDRVLALGFVMQSPAERELGAAVTLADVQELRRVVDIEAVLTDLRDNVVEPAKADKRKNATIVKAEIKARV